MFLSLHIMAVKVLWGALLRGEATKPLPTLAFLRARSKPPSYTGYLSPSKNFLRNYLTTPPLT